MEIEISLHPKQLEVFNCHKRFRVLMAGRRFGKTYLARAELLIAALKDKNEYGQDLRHSPVWYIAPTLGQAKELMWEPLKELANPVIANVSEKDLWIELKNGRRIYLKNAEAQDSLRGRGIHHIVLDEFDAMRDNIWDLILRPALADYKGSALFIGTPAPGGKLKEFYERGQSDDYPDWASFWFGTMDNPTIDPEEIKEAKKQMSSAAFRQEFLADPTAAGGGAFNVDKLKYADKPSEPGSIVMAVDLAGFVDSMSMVTTKKQAKKLDESAIAVVEVTRDGWFVHEIEHGRWGVEETALRIIQLAQKYKPVALGIERGALMNAVGPYLEQQMRRYGVFPPIHALSHNNAKKTDRIIWALQGRVEHGQLTLNSNRDWEHFIEEMQAFPHPYVHDDLLDALAYVDHLAVVNYVSEDEFEQQYFTPYDSYAGY